MKNNLFTRVISLVCCMALVLSLAACNVVPPEPTGTNGTQDTTNPTQDTTSPTQDTIPVEVNKDGYLQETLVSPLDFITNTTGTYYADYESFAEEQQLARALSIEIAAEGDVLLKNENNVLPFSSDVKNVTLFGMHSVALIQSTSGSGGGSTGANGIAESTLPQAMEDAGFNVNDKLVTLYEKYNSLGTITNELPMEYYTNAVIGTYNGYNDAAIIVISRCGSEGKDLAANNAPDHANPDDHALMLDDNEAALIKHAKQYFDKVIVLINSSNILQIPELAEPKTDSNMGVDAILWIGNTGNNAIEAVPMILKGDVNPSGHTVDLWATDFTKGPTWTNFSANTQNKDANGNRLDSYLYYEGQDTGYRIVEYREGIYMGYRYYETMATDMNAKEAGSGDAWYEENVLYPFGYGLSYTTFDWELCEEVAPTATIEAANSTVTLRVKVTNTGSVAGKDVVQVYYSAPYTPGGIEKASTNLVDFAKTDLLQPGESQILEIQFVAQDMASFDWNDANGNGFKGYELEKGDYTITLNRNSHDVALSVTRTIAEDIQCTTDYESGNPINPVFVDNYTTVNDTLLANEISRENGLTQPAVSTKEDRTITTEYKELLDSQYDYRSYRDQTDDPWYVSSVPAGWTQAVEGTQNPTIMIQDMTGVEYTDAEIVNGEVVLANDEGSKKWDEFMNQLTWAELTNLVQTGGGIAAVPSVDVDGYGYADGPVQFGGGTLWACAPITAATFNVELAEEQGRMIGNEGILRGRYYWAGPGLNVHRNPLSGRNQEYYSEDGVQGGMIAAAVVKGATDMGVTCYIKHMFLNDQEAYRDINGGVLTFANEQAIREIYAVSFEMALKNGHSTGIMSAFNRLGNINSALNHAMHEDLVRDEWGSDAIWVTDSWMGTYCPLDLMVRAGDPQVLGSPSKFPDVALEVGEWSAAENCVLVAGDADGETTVASPTHYVAVRRAAQELLYNYANTGPVKNGQTDVSEVTVVTFDQYCNESVAVTIPGLDTSSITLAGNSQLPEGFSMDDAGVISGKGMELGEWDITVQAVVDGYITVSAPVKIQVVNPIRSTGSDLSNLKVGESVETLFDSNYYTYNNVVSTDAATGVAGSGWRILNWYWVNEADNDADRTLGHLLETDIEATDARYITQAQLDAGVYESYIYSYSYEGILPAGLSFEPVTTTHTGTQGASYDVECGYKLVGTPTEAGDYTIVVKLQIPMVRSLGGRFPNFKMLAAPAVLTIEREITIHVE